jgi:outer membrane protein insertion porin family
MKPLERLEATPRDGVSVRRRGACLAALLAMALPGTIRAALFQPFEVKDIRIEGLQRISPGTIFNYLRVKVGERFDEKQSEQAIRDLFKTGFFKDVRLEREGDVLVVWVTERPAVSVIEIEGNKDIDTEALMEALERTGLAEGQVFDRQLLNRIEQELQRQYFARGKYGVRVETTVTPLERNRIGIQIAISEGRVARIKRIALVGNKVFETEDLLDEFKLSTPTFLSFYTKNDRYSKQKLAGDLEALRSYYMDRGYMTFNIDSTQVSITPDKKDIYITVNVTEGEQYTVKEVKIAGKLVIPEEELVPLIKIQPGAIFSRKQAAESANAITEALGNVGFAFANVNTVPDIDKENKEVRLTFFVDPGRRIYVRRINMAGNTRTRDEVLRREMRQMEAAVYSGEKIKRSRERLDRLGFFKEVNVETPAVPGSIDEVDIDFHVEEKPSGNLMAGIGYSSSQGVVLSGSITQDNFLGSGKRVGININNSNVNTNYGFSYTNPYYTVDGVSRGFSAYFRETDASQANVTNYATDVFGGSVTYGLPVNEYDRVVATLRVEATDLETTSTSSNEVLDFVTKNGRDYVTLLGSAGWSHDTRNRALFPSRGQLQSLSAEVALPGGDLNYYKLSYRHQWYQPLGGRFTMMLNGEFGYGDGYGDTDTLPFFENFYAGGIRSVRGYVSNTLGPRDSRDDPIGGDMRVVGNAELILPTPFDDYDKTLRVSAFYDIGNVFGTGQDFKAGDLRSATGLQAIWMSPVGPMTLSVASPLNDKASDETETFQFTLGTNF